MKEAIFRKSLVIGIIILFVGASVIPSISGNISKLTKENSEVTPEDTSNVDWWPMFHHDPSRSGYSTSDAPETNNVRWSCKIGPGYSDPSIDNGKIYISGRYMYCLDADTGSKIWQYSKYSNVVTNAVANGKVYVGHANYLDCLNADTGAKIWSYKVISSDGAESPAVVNGKVYFSYCKWDDMTGRAYCLNADTGATIWIYITDGPIYSSPAIANGKVYIAEAGNSKLHCLNADTGVKIWESGLDCGSIAVANGRVYIGSYGGMVYCLNADTGTKIWEYTTGGEKMSSPAVANGRIYIGAADGTVYCFGSGHIENHPPNKPDTPDGPTSGKTVKAYTYTTSTTDPDGDDIYYWFDWGDGTDSGWRGPYSSGDTCEAPNAWGEEGSYEIKVRAQDTRYALSEWSDPLSVSMPKTKRYFNTPFLNFLQNVLQNHPLIYQLFQRFLQL